jgi:hypothetical protein
LENPSLEGRGLLQVKVDADIYGSHKPYDENHRVSRLRENLTSGSEGEGLETGSLHRAGGVYAGLTGHGDGNSKSGKNWQLINQWTSPLPHFPHFPRTSDMLAANYFVQSVDNADKLLRRSRCNLFSDSFSVVSG